MRRNIFPLVLILLFFIMLIKPRETFTGASEGLLLWFQIVLPTLLPFIIITNLLVHTNTMFYFAKFLSPVISPLFHTSPNGTFAVVTGFLCGYPMGAKVTADLIRSEKITRSEGAYLLSFCNNTSPVFIMNYAVIKSLGRDELILPSIAILFLSPILCSFVFRRFYFGRKKGKTYVSGISDSHIQFDFQILDDTIMNGFETITKVGGYIILFSVLITLAQEVPLQSVVWKLILLPSLEVTNGISMIVKNQVSFSVVFILVMGLTSFGGICSVAQTQCMIQGTGLRIVPYSIEKLITAVVTSFLAFIYIQFGLHSF